MKKTILFVWILAIIVFISCENPSFKKDPTDMQIVTIKGEKHIAEDFIVDDQTLLQIEAGAKLIFSEDARMIVSGMVRAEGTKENPIIFTSEDEESYWRGIEIKGLMDIPETDKFWDWLENGNKTTEDEFFTSIDHGHLFSFCQFSNTAPFSKKFERKNKWMGTIEAYNTHIRITNCSFSGIHHFGGVLTQRSLVLVDHCLFDDVSMHKAINSTDRSVGVFIANTIIGHRACNARCADGIWTKKFTGLIANNHVETVADDGIDTDNSQVIVYNNKVTGVFDDGIDIDNKGLAYILYNKIDGVLENGILMSDGSQIVAVKNEILNSEYGICLRDGAEVVTDGLNLHNNRYGVILYQNLPTAISTKDFIAIKNKLMLLTPDEIHAEEYIEGVEGPEDLVNMLDVYYEDRDDFFLFRKVLFKNVKKLDPLKKLFKIAGTLNLDHIENTEIKNHPLTQATKNGLFLSGATIVDNTMDVGLFHNYNLKIEGSTFTSQEVEQAIMDECHCDENHKCEIIDKLNTSGVEINTKKIIKRVEAL